MCDQLEREWGGRDIRAYLYSRHPLCIYILVFNDDTNDKNKAKKTQRKHRETFERERETTAALIVLLGLEEMRNHNKKVRRESKPGYVVTTKSKVEIG